MAEPSVVKLMKQLTRDPVRARMPFTEDVAKTNDLLFGARSDAEVAEYMRKWLYSHQPCVFGRTAAGPSDLLTFCILTERDLAQADSAIMAKIQESRLQWRRKAYEGKKSGFVILAMSQQVLEAAPDAHLQRLAQRIAELYLLEAIEPDKVFHERIWLDILKDDHVECREWVVGVNFFGVQADGRWWHDHRIPGGIAFSMNSVGHMIRSGSEHNLRAEQMAAAAGEGTTKKKPVDSLDLALRYAMLTIDRAHDTISGKATCLRPVPSDGGKECPLSQIPAPLVGKDWETYLGWYHTDQTIPSAYFRGDVERPKDVEQIDLDFTYLYDESNIDYYRTGPGVKTR